MELSPGDSSRAVHTSPPLPGDISRDPDFRRSFQEMIRTTIREEIQVNVREQLGKMFPYNLPPQRPPPDQTNKAQYCLVFLNKVKDRIYTNDLVTTENGDPIKVAICDTFTQSIISTDHSLSSAIVILTVLDTEFWENKGETWSWSEFNQSVLRGRNGKAPILTGPRLTIQLKNGVGTFENIFFNDNSSWSKGRSIRLGVMVEGEGEQGYLNGKRVQEGVSASFRVLDRRSKVSEKPKQLILTDSVKCIKKVGKDRASILQKKDINTVEDFLKLYYIDDSALREILGIKSESSKEWDSMVEHATQCADEFHAKYNALNNSSQPQQVREEMHVNVREELGKRSHYNLPAQRPPPDQTNKAQYCLVFLNKVKDRIYTNDLVTAENGDPIKVAICDTFTQSIISTDHSLSSAIVILTVLNAEFWENKGETWSWSEFNQSVLRGRKGKASILTGRRLTIQLKNGVGTFENIFFNDNSSWSRDRFIRLGVMVEGEGEQGYLNGKRVQEDVSKPFRVLDRRSKVSEKPKQLKLKHSVKFIQKVGKNRASILEKKDINTVEDFLKLYYIDDSALREILGIKSESDKGWIYMVEHVTQCADEFRTKYNASNNSSQPRQVSMDKGVNNLKPSTNQFQDLSGISSEALVQPMERNMSLCANGGLCVVGLGSSEPNRYENKIIEGDIPEKCGQHSPICGSSSMDISNEHISTAYVEHIVETQPALFLETNRTNVERGNILNGNSVQHTNDDDAESSSSYNTQVSSGGGGYDRRVENRNNNRPRIMFAVLYG